MVRLEEEDHSHPHSAHGQQPSPNLLSMLPLSPPFCSQSSEAKGYGASLEIWLHSAQLDSAGRVGHLAHAEPRWSWEF